MSTVRTPPLRVRNLALTAGVVLLSACAGAGSGGVVAGTSVRPDGCPITPENLEALTRLSSFAGTSGYIPAGLPRSTVWVSVRDGVHRMRTDGAPAIRVIQPAGGGGFAVTVVYSYVPGLVADAGFDAHAAAMQGGETGIKPCAMAVALDTSTPDAVTRDTLRVLAPSVVPHLVVVGTGDSPADGLGDTTGGGGAIGGGAGRGGNIGAIARPQ